VKVEEDYRDTEQENELAPAPDSGCELRQGARNQSRRSRSAVSAENRTQSLTLAKRSLKTEHKA